MLMQHTNVATARRLSFALVALLFSNLVHAAQFSALVNDAGGKPLADAVVYLLPSAGTPVPTTPPKAQIDQKNRDFVPMVSVMQTGTVVNFPNSDNIRHQVYSFSPAKIFNLKLYSGKPANPVIFDKPGPVVLGCNIHDQMVAWVLVVDTPWFAKTNSNGEASITAPDGDYEIALWHPGQRREADKTPLGLSGKINKTFVLDAAPVSGAHAQHATPGR